MEKIANNLEDSGSFANFAPEFETIIYDKEIFDAFNRDGYGNLSGRRRLSGKHTLGPSRRHGAHRRRPETRSRKHVLQPGRHGLHGQHSRPARLIQRRIPLRLRYPPRRQKIRHQLRRVHTADVQRGILNPRQPQSRHQLLHTLRLRHQLGHILARRRPKPTRETRRLHRAAHIQLAHHRPPLRRRRTYPVLGPSTAPRPHPSTSKAQPTWHSDSTSEQCTT